MKRILLVALAVFPCGVLAGGSGQMVMIESLGIEDGAYKMVVVPQPQEDKDPFMGDCPKFTVYGGYARLYAWQFPKFVNRENHGEALAYLKQAYVEKKPVHLGWMGTGFVPIDPSNKCVVRSRALQLWKDEKGTAVVSYHNAV